MRQDDYTYLSVAVADGVARITIGDGENCNIYRRPALADFQRLPSDLAADDDVAAALIVSTGEAFTLGLHPDDYPRDTQGAGTARFDSARRSLRAWIDLDKPVVVGLNGPVQGAPLTTVFLADVVIAEDHVVFRDFHVAAGLVSATGALLWPPSAGLLRAKRYVLGSEWITAHEAERLGLVTEVVARGEAGTRAYEYARRLAAMPTEAVRHTKRALNEWVRQAVPTIFEPALSVELLGWTAADDVEQRRQGLTAEAVEIARRSAAGGSPSS